MSLWEPLLIELFITTGKKIYKEAEKFLKSLDIYNAYQGAEKEIWIQVSTWPVFPELEDKLTTSTAKTVVIMGPVEKLFTLPGVLWRFKLKREREKHQRRVFLYHIPHIPPFAKFILVDDRLFISEETERRTLFYTKKTIEPDDLSKLKSILLKELPKNGEDALLKVYSMIASRARNGMNYDELISNLRTAYRASVEENEEILGKEHRNLGRGDLVLCDINT